MENKNPIHTLGDYSILSHEGYRNTIKLLDGNNVVPLRSDTIWLVQNECSFHRLRSEDPNQHLKDFLKLVDSLDLDVANMERTRLHLFQFSLAIKLAIGLNVFQQDPSPLGRILLLIYLLNSFHRNYSIMASIFGSKSKSFMTMSIPPQGEPSISRLVAISLPQDVPGTSDRHLIELKNQVQRLMEAHLAPKSSVQVNKIASSCDICSNEAGDFMIVEDISSIIDPRQSQVVLGKPFVEVSNMTYDSSIRVVKFTIGDNEIAYKIPHKIEQYNSLSDLEKEHTKSVYFRNEEDKRR
ncbi:hypothetical protein Tco_1244375 [Tanacetum coccineum]